VTTATDDPTVTEYVFKQPVPVPAEVALVLGDVLHNLRSALDSLVFALTEDGLGRELSEPEEKACQFPIAKTPEDFQKFFDGHGTRKEIMKEPMPAALRVPQWFYVFERAGREPTIEVLREEGRFGNLQVLNRLSNIDKHRRLPISVWWPAFTYWGSDGPTQHKWEYLATWPLRDGDVIGRFTGPPDMPHVHHEFHLVAVDARPPGDASADLPRVAEDWLWSVRTTICQVLQEYFDRRKLG
jgi:hypothetical protein